MRPKSSRSAVVALATVGLLFAYPLSVGPIHALFGSSLDLIYAPLLFLPEPIVDSLDDYALFCDRLWREF
jgi:hypothetical protein